MKRQRRLSVARGGRTLSLLEVAKIMGLTYQAVYQIEQRAMRKIRDRFPELQEMLGSLR